MRIVRAYILDQSHAFQDITATVQLVWATMGDGQGQIRAVLEQDDGWHGKTAIDSTRHLSKLRSAIGAGFQIRRHKQKGILCDPYQTLERGSNG